MKYDASRKSHINGLIDSDIKARRKSNFSVKDSMSKFLTKLKPKKREVEPKSAFKDDFDHTPKSQSSVGSLFKKTGAKIRSVFKKKDKPISQEEIDALLIKTK